LLKLKSKKSVDLALKHLNKTNLSILNYPEGTRTDFHSLDKFKKGGFILAIQSNIAILPISVVYNKKNVNNNIRDVSLDNLPEEIEKILKGEQVGRVRVVNE